MRVRVLSDTDTLERIGAEWRALEQVSATATVFQGFDFTSLWARQFMHQAGRRDRLCVVLVSDADALQMVLPLCVSSVAGVRVGRITGAPISQYSAVLARPEADIEACLAAAQRALREQHVDVLELIGVRSDSLLRRWGEDRLRPPSNAREAPFLRLATWPSHEAYLRSRSKNATKSLRNRRNQLDRVGTVRFEVLACGAGAREAMQDAVGLKRDWLAERGALSSAFADPLTGAFLLDLAAELPGAVVHRMLVDGAPAAVRLGLQYQGTLYSYLSAYDPAFSQYSPGKLLMDFTLETARADTLAFIDMLPPTGEHKTVWCDEEIAVADYLLPLNLRGACYASMRDHFVPSARWAWHHLPARIRGVVARRFLRT